MIIGYKLSIDDNDSFMILNGSDIPRCDKCGFKLDVDFCDKKFRLKRKFDISYTYDGFCIVSQKFVDFCNKNRYTSLRFREIECSHGYYCLFVENEVTVDREKSNLEFERFCEYCGNFESVTGGTPSLYIRNNDLPLDDDFYRTDLMFGSEDEKFPFIIVGADTRDKMITENFTGLDFDVMEK